MRKIVKLVVPCMIGATGLFGLVPSGGAQAAPAASPASLPITSYYQMVVDPAHGHIFFSQGSSSQNGILVTDLAGQVVTTITGQTGVMGIALSPDGSAIYAALRGADAVSAISTTSLMQTASYPLPAGDAPQDVAVQSGKIWVSYDTGTVGQAAVGDIDLTAASPSFAAQAATGGWYSAPELAADPQDSGVLVAAEPGLSPSSVASYDTTVDPVAVRAQSSFFTNCENQRDLAVVPGGSEFILACGWPYAHYRYSTTTLSQLGSYGTTSYPNAVALDANGDVAAGSSTTQNAPDVYVYQPAGGALANTLSLAGSNADLAARGLALLPDGSKLFAVIAQGIPATSYALSIVAAPKLTQTTLSLTAPSAVTLSTPVNVTGSLVASTGPLAAGTPVTVVRSSSGGTATATFHETTSASGSFSLTDTPPSAGTYTYAAGYAGSATSAPASASQTVTVTRIPTSLKLTTPSTSLVYEPTLTLTAHLGTTYTNRSVSIYAQSAGSSTKSLLKAGTVNSAGNLTVSYTAPRNTTFSAVFSGDARYSPATVTTRLIVKAKVSAAVSGYYGSRLVGGITYRLFHRTKPLGISTTVIPNKAGQCVKIEIQEYYSGGWRANSLSACGTLGSTSKAAGTVNVSQADLGYHYRLRIDYVGDVTNGANKSPWQYVIIEP
jgi:hypothetical protein